MTPATLRTARLTGAAYLGIVVTGIFAEFFVRGALVVPLDAAQTAENIAAASGLFGLGMAADLCMVALDVGVAIGLYRLLRPHHPQLALAATVFRLMQSALLLANLRHLPRALALAQEATTGRLDQGLSAAVLEAMRAHALGYDLALIPFGLACLALGRLLRRMQLAPRPLSIGLSATGAVYLAGSLSALLAPDLSPAIDPLYGVAILVEPAFGLWLIFRARAALGDAAASPSKRAGFAAS